MVADYKCKKCGIVYERKINDKNYCCGQLMERVYSPLGIIYKQNNNASVQKNR
jgi:hypothetical protein